MHLLNEKNIKADVAKVERIVGLMKERVNFVQEIWDKSSFFFEKPASYDAASVQKFWKEDTSGIMKELIAVLDSIHPFEAHEIEGKIMAFINEKGYGTGKVMNALRLVLIGNSNGPGVADISEILGKEETLERINMAIETI